jgi:glycosyltransferase involved in cell wall biosynthesis
MEFARECGVPGLLEVNAPLVEEQAAYRGLIDRAGAERVAARAFAAARAVVAVSREVAGYVEQFTDARVHVVPNGVDPDRFPPDLPPSLPDPTAAFTVGFVGTLKPWHGLPVLVEAFDRLHHDHPHTRLLVVGDGPERPALEADLSARDLARSTVLTGAVDAAEVPGLLASVDAAVAPYPDRPDFYFSPLKLYEYLAAGRAVVASRIGQVTGVIEDGANGLLVPPGDADALAAALARLRADAALQSRLGAAARETVRHRHTWDAVARRLLALAGWPAEVGV